jgi:hypothetical protein
LANRESGVQKRCCLVSESGKDTPREYQVTLSRNTAPINP